MQDILRTERETRKFRLLALLILVAMIYYQRAEISLWPVVPIAIGYLVYLTLLHRFMGRLPARWLPYVMLIMDVAFVSSSLGVFGVESAFFVFFPVLIIFYAVHLGYAGSLISASMVSFAYIALAYQQDADASLGRMLPAQIPLFFVMALFAGYLAQRRRGEQKERQELALLLQAERGARSMLDLTLNVAAVLDPEVLQEQIVQIVASAADCARGAIALLDVSAVRLNPPVFFPDTPPGFAAVASARLDSSAKWDRSSPHWPTQRSATTGGVVAGVANPVVAGAANTVAGDVANPVVADVSVRQGRGRGDGHLAPGTNLVAPTAEEREALKSGELLELHNPAPEMLPAWARETPVAYALLVPLVAGDNALGMMWLVDGKPHMSLSSAQSQLVHNLARFFVPLIANARAYSAAQKQSAQLSSELRGTVHQIVRIQQSQKRSEVRVGHLFLEPTQMRAMLGAKALDLSAREFDVLYTLARHAGRPVNQEVLLREVWSDQGQARSNAVDVAIARLRRKLTSQAQAGDLIQTVRGVGYMLDEPRAAMASMASTDLKRVSG